MVTMKLLMQFAAWSPHLVFLATNAQLFGCNEVELLYGCNGVGDIAQHAGKFEAGAVWPAV